MKIVVIGGTGLIGTKVVDNLTAQGHQAIAASPSSGVNAVTGEGLAEALAGAQVVVDVANSPSFDDGPVLTFFTTSTANLLSAERAAGVGHHVALSVVGAGSVPESGYLRAKAAQEELIKESGVPYTIVRATQFFEFASTIADVATDGNTVRLPHALMQPIAADDVATAVTRAVTNRLGRPVNGITEIAGPEQFGMDDFIRTGLTALGDPRQVVTDSAATYFGAAIDDTSIVPRGAAVVYPTSFGDWLTAAEKTSATIGTPGR